MTHLRSLVGERHPASSPRRLLQARRYLESQFTRAGWTTELHPFQALGGIYHNVVARRDPETANLADRQAPLLIGAHYDTVRNSPGADDNASALAVLLEVAARLRRRRLTRPVWLAAFTLEEEDLLGSLAFAAGLRDRGRPLAGAIILECVGFARQEEGSQDKPPGVPIPVPTVANFLAVVGNRQSAELTSVVERACRRHLPTVGLVVPGNGEQLPDTRRSDHAAFWHYGYPAVMLTDTANFRNPHYHRPSDTIETLDLAFLARVLEAVTRAVEDLAGTGPATGAP